MAKMALGYMETQLAKWTDEPIESLNEIQTNVCLNSLNSFIKQIKLFPPCDAEYKINKLKLYVIIYVRPFICLADQIQRQSQ